MPTHKSLFMSHIQHDHHQTVLVDGTKPDRKRTMLVSPSSPIVVGLLGFLPRRSRLFGRVREWLRDGSSRWWARGGKFKSQERGKNTHWMWRIIPVWVSECDGGMRVKTSCGLMRRAFQRNVTSEQTLSKCFNCSRNDGFIVSYLS